MQPHDLQHGERCSADITTDTSSPYIPARVQTPSLLSSCLHSLGNEALERHNLLLRFVVIPRSLMTPSTQGGPAPPNGPTPTRTHTHVKQQHPIVLLHY